MISELRQRDDGDLGGLLHPLIEDWHLDCLILLPAGDYTQRTVQLSEQIRDRLAPMTEAQRGAVLARSHGWI